MKRIIIGLAALAVLAGCTPSAEQVNKTATAIGYAAGLVANQTKIDDSARNILIEVLGDVRSCIPAKEQSYEDAWTPVIKFRVMEFVEAGKLDTTTGNLVTTVAIMAAKAVDYMFDVRFPDAKQYETLIGAGVSGALDGFLTVFKPANESRSGIELDAEAYDWFSKNLH